VEVNAVDSASQSTCQHEAGTLAMAFEGRRVETPTHNAFAISATNDRLTPIKQSQSQAQLCSHDLALNDYIY
jgi:hypothetical protein